MKMTAMMVGLACLACSTAVQAATPMLFEEAYAREEEKLIIPAPIAGIQNSLWFDYRIDVMEAQKELSSDLHKADDIEDLRGAWEEYGDELAHERKTYIKKMAKRGYRMGSVIVEDMK